MAAQSDSIPKIFLSHSSADNAFCDRLVKDLRQYLGDEDAVWYDRDGLHGGDAWSGKINEQILARPIFIVILSKDATESKWVDEEISVAWDQRGKLGRRLFSIQYKEEEKAYKVREDVEGLQFFDFRPPRPYKEAFDHLVTECLILLPSSPSRRELLLRVVSTITLALLPGLLSASSLLPETSLSSIDTDPSPPPSIFPSNPLLYRADWSGGLNGWTAPLSSNEPICRPSRSHEGWLFCDDNSLGDLYPSNSIFAPYKPPTANYAVEVEMQVVDILPRTACSLGLLVRWTQDPLSGSAYGGYILGIGGFATLKTPFFQGKSLQAQLAGSQYRLGQKWHRYRAEAKNDTLAFYVDNAKIFSQIDSAFQLPGQVALGCSGCRLNIRNFEVFGL